MATYQSKVALFHKVFGHPCPSTKVSIISDELKKLRYNLIKEELDELKTALKDNDSNETLDALCDILYVTMGYRVVCGFEDSKDKNLELVKLNREIDFVSAVPFDKKSQVVIDTYLSKLDDIIEDIQQFANLDNLVELDKALNNMNEVTFELGCYLNYDLDVAFQRVQDSNMSKICETEEIARETIEKYSKDNTGLSVNYRSSEFGGFVVYNEKTGKILKSCRFKVPDFTGLY